MPIDKTWKTIENRNTEEFSIGLKSFVRRSEAHVDNRGLIRCPCRKCVSCDFVIISLMKAHIERFGCSRRYITWVYHGETIPPPIVDDIAPRNEMASVIYISIFLSVYFLLLFTYLTFFICSHILIFNRLWMITCRVD